MSGPVAPCRARRRKSVPVKTARDMLALPIRVPGRRCRHFRRRCGRSGVRRIRPIAMKKGRDDAALANVSLTENPRHLLATLARGQTPRPRYVVGFTAETKTCSMERHARLQKRTPT